MRLARLRLGSAKTNSIFVELFLDLFKFVFTTGSSGHSKGPGGPSGPGVVHLGTSMEVSSITSAPSFSLDKSGADKMTSRKVEKVPTKKGGPKLADPHQGLPIISEKSGPPSEISNGRG
jgi:hypothetical protein